jgi:hypothetical protein
MSYRYSHAILGGTFDHFHLGHQALLAAAFRESDHVTIGIVETPLSPKKSFSTSVEDFLTRKQNLYTYLQSQKLLSRTTIIPITDIYGTSLINPGIEAIFVTEETHGNAIKINVERQKLGLLPLKIVVVPYTLANDNQTISSGRIRAGQIDRHGHSYLQFFLSKSSYRLPAHLRPVLAHPIGPVYTDTNELLQSVPKACLVVSVGDIVSLALHRAGRPASISIIDYRTERRDLDKKDIEKVFPSVDQKLANPAGSINPEFAPLFIWALGNLPQTIVVEGEEDLLALPAIFLAPLNTFVIYGQSGLGMVLVKVTEELKSTVQGYLKEF